jgi:hypothetical protein
MGAVSRTHYQRKWRDRAAAREPEAGIVLVSGTEAPAFPDVCPVCLAPARLSIPVERTVTLIVSDGEDNTTIHPVESFQVPFCAACVQRHRAEMAPPDPWLPLWRATKGGGEGVGGLIVCGVGFFFFYEGLTKLSWIPIVFSFLPFLVGGFLVRQTWAKNRYLAVPGPTKVSSALDFTVDLSEAFEPAWRAFVFQNVEYAERFREANAHRLWNPRGAQAQQARKERQWRHKRMSYLGMLAFAAMMLWYFYDTYIGPLVQWLVREPGLKK